MLSYERVADMITNCVEHNGYRGAIVFENYAGRRAFADCFAEEIYGINDVGVKQVLVDKIVFTNGSVLAMLTCSNCWKSPPVNEIVIDSQADEILTVYGVLPDIVTYRDPIIHDSNTCAEASPKELQDPLDVFIGSFNVYDG